MSETVNNIKRRQVLLPRDIRARLPGLGQTDKHGLQALALVKFFTPDAGWTWYATEFDGRDIFFGLVVGAEVELGDFSLSELETVRGALGLPVERDFHFRPTTLEVLMKHHDR